MSKLSDKSLGKLWIVCHDVFMITLISVKRVWSLRMCPKQYVKFSDACNDRISSLFLFFLS